MKGIKKWGLLLGCMILAVMMLTVQADYTDRTQSVHQSPYAHRAGGFSEFYQ